MEAQVAVVPDAGTVARETAQRVLAALDRALNERHVAHIALTGGSMAAPLYRELAQPGNRSAIDWSRVHLWWGDERFVPIDHPESNAFIAYNILLGVPALAGQSGDGSDENPDGPPGLPIDPQHVHPIPVEEALGDDDPVELAAQRYAEELTRHVLLARGGVPRFDVLLSGLGPDGHILSIFPGSPALAADAPIAMAIAAPTHVEPHLARITLSARVVAEAGLVMIMAAGSGKSDIVASVLGETVDVVAWPAQVARSANAVWLLDEAAAAQWSKNR